jgi:cytochrome c5
MIMKKIFGVVLFCASVLLISCSKTSGSSGAYVPTAADATANATLTQLQQGRSLFVANCQSCHNLPNPDDYTSGGWSSILNSMAPRTSLSSSEVTLVYKYVSRGQ